MTNLKLTDREWREFRIGDIFVVSRGKRLIEKDRKKGEIPYYSASSVNNGVTDYISNPLFTAENKLLVTTFCDCYFADRIFTASDEITILDNEKLNKYSGKFISTIVMSNKNKYAFGRKAFTDRIREQKILLPAKMTSISPPPPPQPDWQFMERYIKQKEQKKIQELMEQLSNKALEQLISGRLTDREWKEFKVGDLFDVNVRGRRLIVTKREEGKTPLVTAGESENGISSFIENKEHKTYSNAITLDMFGNAFYQKNDFKCDDNITVLQNENMTKYSAFFIITLLNRLREKYSYGNQVRPNRLKNDRIMLPIDKNKIPDWEFMEAFMRKIEEDKVKNILEYYQNSIKMSSGGVNNDNKLSYWQEFEVESLFKIKIGKNIDGNKVNKENGMYAYVTRKENINGVDGFIDFDNSFLNVDTPVITIGNETAEPFVQTYPFFTGTKVNILIPKNNKMNKDILFFIATSLKQHKSKYSYSFTINSTRLKKQKILLPTKNNQIDWQGMERYIREKELEKIIELLKYYQHIA